MKTIGSVILLVSLGLLVLVAINATSSMTEEVINNTNDSTIVGQTDDVSHATSPLLLVFGFLVVLLGGMIAVNTFR
jgi:hypothetical protein